MSSQDPGLVREEVASDGKVQVEEGTMSNEEIAAEAPNGTEEEIIFEKDDAEDDEDVDDDGDDPSDNVNEDSAGADTTPKAVCVVKDSVQVEGKVLSSASSCDEDSFTASNTSKNLTSVDDDGRSTDYSEEASGIGASGTSYHVKNSKKAEDRDQQQSSEGGGGGSDGLVQCWLQLWALLIKNGWTKLRTPTATFFELLSPLLMMLVLVAAHNLSEIKEVEAEQFSSIQLSVPGPWLGLLGGFASLGDVGNIFGIGNNSNEPDSDDRRRRNLWKKNGINLEPSVEDNILRNDDEDPWESLFDGLSGRFDTLMNNRHSNYDDNEFMWGTPTDRKLQFFPGESGDDEVDVNADVYSLLDEAQREIAALLKGPIPVPSFNQFVRASDLIGKVIGVDSLPDVFTDSRFGRQWGNLLSLGTIHLCPSAEPMTDMFWSYLNTTYPGLQNILRIRVHDDEAAALLYIDQNLDERTWALMDFSQQSTDDVVQVAGEEAVDGDDEDEVRFKLRMNFTTIPNTNQIVDYVSIGLNTRYQMYYLSGYLTLQRTVNEFLLSQEDDCEEQLASIGSIWSFPMPTAAYSQNPFFLEIGYLLGLTMVMAFLYPTSRLVKTIVEEKESKMKETLFILGLRGWVHWLSWVVTSGLVFLFITVTCTVALSNNVLVYSDAWYLFAYIGLFAAATVGFCFALASLFSRAKLASIIGPMALFATILPRFIFFGTNRYEATTGKMIASLLPATAFAFGADIIAETEYAELGIQDWNVNDGDYSFRTCLNFLFIDTLLYFFLGWYLEQVMPRDFGTRQPVYFLLTPKYWLSFCVKSKPSTMTKAKDSVDPEDDAAAMEHVDETQLVAGVRIRNLFKQYRPDQDPAVDHLNLTLYESQVTALLGSNGAGKTTTVSMLTGLLRPTSGDCVLYGSSIVNEPAVARKSIGICPQHNILFDNLTVLEHIHFFLRIKGIRPKSSVVHESALEVGLGDFLKTTSIALSGGNKRKLSVAVAFSGDPKVLILDEPTSAMDPHSRRAIWELIREKRQGRVICLTTHFMDEAETLSDRIAIMKTGTLQCVGSPLFLKNRFGLGYNMVVVMEDGVDRTEDVDSVTSFMQKQVPGTELVRSSGKELTYRFPPGSESLFPDAFDAFEKKWKWSFGVSNSSLEEVFLEIAKNEDEPSTNLKVARTVNLSSKDDTEKPQQRSEYLSPFAQIALLYGKRLTVQKRDGKGACFSIVVPVIVMALVLLVLMIDPRMSGSSIEASPTLYRETSNGDIGQTDIVISNGFTRMGDTVGNESLLSGENINADFLRLKESFEKTYEHATVSVMSEQTSSASVSDYLLATYNDRDHHLRYGAYVLQDNIDLLFNVNWEEMFSLFLDSLNGAGFEWPGFESLSLPMQFNVTVDDMAKLMFYWTGTDANLQFAFNNSAAQLIVQESLLDIFNRLSSNATTLLDDFEDAFQTYIEFGLSAAVLASNQTVDFDLNGTIDFDFNQTVLDDFLPNPDILLDQASILLSQFVDLPFNRTVIAKSYEQILGNLLSSFDAELLRNSTRYIDAALDFLESNNVAPVTPLLLLNGILPLLEDYSVDGISTINQLIGVLSELLGGSADSLDGYVTLSIKDLSLDMASKSLHFDAAVLSSIGTLLNITWTSPPVNDEEISYTLPISTKASVLHNASSSHAVAAFNQAFLQHIHNQCSKSKTMIRSFNEPLPLTTQQSVEVKTILSILAVLFLLIPFCYIPGAFVVFLVKERVCKSKHLQLVSGVNMTSYWVANFLWDMSLFFVLTVLTMCCFLAYGSDSAEVFVGTTKSFFASALLFFGYGSSVLPFSYIFVRNFNNPSSAQISIIGVIFITGFVAVNAYFIMSSLENTKDIAESLQPLFRMWPAYNVGEGFINLAISFWEREILGGDGDVFAWEVTGKSLFLLYILSPVYFVILLLLEYAQDGGSGGALGIALRNLKRSYDRSMLHWSLARSEAAENVEGARDSFSETDKGVQEEAKVVEESKEELVRTAPIVIHNLWKIYPPSTGFLCVVSSFLCRPFCRLFSKRNPEGTTEEDNSLPKPAICGTSIAVRQGETLGLLGKNGCGKSTTLNILTGDVPLTSGEAFVAGQDIRGGKGVAAARRRIGFCPQTDPLLDLMTGRETLAMFARLRGVEVDQIDDVVQNLMDRLTLTPHADKVSFAYSGGNKRKLSLGVAALVGDGGALLVDESSSGMDPGARRKMWSLMQELAERRSVVLTTHSMEEAEALSSRIVVMDKGRFVALGTVQQLKTKFLDGYTIDMNFVVGTSSDVIDASIADLTESVLPGCKIAERYGRFLRFNVDGVSRLGLGTTFRHLQEFKERSGCIEGYSVSQCTLEQVFLKLVEDARTSHSS